MHYSTLKRLGTRTAQPLIRETKPWRHLVQLHKANGNDFAKAISVAWAIGLVVILGSGIVMVWTAPPFRRLAGRASAAGLVSFAAYVLLG